MNTLISLEFSYRSKKYFALARALKICGETHYRLNILNGMLEKSLYGNHIIVQKENDLRFTDDVPVPEAKELRQCLVNALADQLRLANTNYSRQQERETIGQS